MSTALLHLLDSIEPGVVQKTVDEPKQPLARSFRTDLQALYGRILVSATPKLSGELGMRDDVPQRRFEVVRDRRGEGQ